MEGLFGLRIPDWNDRQAVAEFGAARAERYRISPAPT